MHAIVEGFTPGNTSFLVVNPDFYFILAMDVIMCTAGWGTFYGPVCVQFDRIGGGSVMIWARICHDGRTQLKIKCSRNIE